MQNFIFCKRFIYFIKCLGIKEHLDNRYKVQKGLNIHDRRLRENKDYLRKRIGVIGKELNVPLVSKKYQVRGIIDEVLTLRDDTMAPLDYKFSSYKERIYDTYKAQLAAYALMFEEVYHSRVDRGYIVFCKDHYKVKEIKISKEDREDIQDLIQEFILIAKGYFPKAPRDGNKCLSCYYRNICIK